MPTIAGLPRFNGGLVGVTVSDPVSLIGHIQSPGWVALAMALIIYAVVMGLQFKQAMHEQADALGQSLTTQTATSATELLVSNDILSLNVLLNNLTKNPLVAHAAIYSVDNRILAEAGQRPKNGLLGETQGLYQTKITFQDVTAGHLRISLDMNQFEQPMTISLQSMGILSAILLALALALSLRAPWSRSRISTIRFSSSSLALPP